MSRQAIAKWSNLFEHEYIDIDEAESKKTPLTTTNSEIAVGVKEFIFPNRHITIDEISNEHGISHLRVYKVIAEHFIKVCGRWVPCQ
ncbi:histone-lysine N-methyltransferase SETMAR [Trichonephila inaurata madagascariensis]|uniref:Histone-lysine N-methyltransferase SETMAR n=1 Tax=Trichonephila inaurata madagascariensis TaxID=2747483 RepID=A0A8X7BSA0_9ARAC|nr:histone-lysine N-methyltransferase SETMAR [Trichonephila inaurata madagascariensis]